MLELRSARNWPRWVRALLVILPIFISALALLFFLVGLLGDGEGPAPVPVLLGSALFLFAIIAGRTAWRELRAPAAVWTIGPTGIARRRGTELRTIPWTRIATIDAHRGDRRAREGAVMLTCRGFSSSWYRLDEGFLFTFNRALWILDVSDVVLVVEQMRAWHTAADPRAGRMPWGSG